MTVDPFAAASMAPTASAPAAPAADPFNGVEIDTADPFATPETVNAGGGEFRRAPGMESLVGRLVVYIPRSFRKDADDPFGDQGAVRDQYVADLYVLTGGDLAWTYKRKDDKGNETEVSELIPASDLPAEFLGTYVTQKALVGQFRRIASTAKPVLMGVLRRGPKADARKAGKTFDSIERAYAAYVQAAGAYFQNGGRGEKPVEPAFSWQVDVDVTPELKAAAIDWWKGAQHRIKPVGPVVDLTGTTK